MSCPRAHQQNEAAERKHRHIVEVGLALLAHASIPLKYWEDAFVAATYLNLINRTPGRVINYETPLERLFQQKSDYLSLRVFGCACWPNLRPYNIRKFQFHSKQCVFLGYSPLHKGFKCLDPPIGRIYISRDVTFDENVFPFSQLHPNAGARLRQEISLLPPDLQPLPYDQGGELMSDHMFNSNNSCEELCAGDGGEFHADSVADAETAASPASPPTSAPTISPPGETSAPTTSPPGETTSPIVQLTGSLSDSAPGFPASVSPTRTGADPTADLHGQASGSSVPEEAASPAAATNAPEISTHDTVTGRHSQTKGVY